MIDNVSCHLCSARCYAVSLPGITGNRSEPYDTFQWKGSRVDRKAIYGRAEQACARNTDSVHHGSLLAVPDSAGWLHVSSCCAQPPHACLDKMSWRIIHEIPGISCDRIQLGVSQDMPLDDIKRASGKCGLLLIFSGMYRTWGANVRLAAGSGAGVDRASPTAWRARGASVCAYCTE